MAERKLPPEAYYEPDENYDKADALDRMVEQLEKEQRNGKNEFEEQAKNVAGRLVEELGS